MGLPGQDPEEGWRPSSYSCRAVGLERLLDGWEGDRGWEAPALRALRERRQGGAV